MHRVILDGTDLEVSKLGFGTAALHHLFSSSERRSLLMTALDGGITHFDTANSYGNGLAEKELGRFFKNVDSNEITISTKVGFNINSFQKHFPMSHIVSRKIINKIIQKAKNPSTDFSPDGCDESFSNSLKSLNIERVNILFIHEPANASFNQLEKLIPWLQLQKTLGKAQYLGLAGVQLEKIKVQDYFPNIFDIFQTSRISMMPNNHLPIQPQIQYGYFSNLSLTQREMAMDKIVTQNSSGMVLYSSRKIERVKMFCAKFTSL
ncbi:aldo/keto reductase [Candidatus Thioglobus sp.]|nr:aldo/keto reductase [Candidatus Thioglobus sp.]